MIATGFEEKPAEGEKPAEEKKPAAAAAPINPVRPVAKPAGLFTGAAEKAAAAAAVPQFQYPQWMPETLERT